MTKTRVCLLGVLLSLIAVFLLGQLRQSLEPAQDPTLLFETEDPAVAGGSQSIGCSGIVRFGGQKRVAAGMGWRTAGTDETWSWNGSGWSQEHPVTTPPPVACRILTLDTDRRRGILFGPVVIDRGNATWEWDGQDWAKRRPRHSPPIRSDHETAYDSNRRRTVLFGGTSTMGSFPDGTWEWDGKDWHEAKIAVSPPGRDRFGMAFDSKRGRTVLFGGATDFSGEKLLSDTWEWDGTTWHSKNSRQSPSKRYRHKIAYDEKRGRTVLLGGLDEKFGFLGDTWEWDGTDWRQVVTPCPGSPRADPLLAFDKQSGSIVLFGGQSERFSTASDTWLYDGVAWKAAAQSERSAESP